MTAPAASYLAAITDGDQAPEVARLHARRLALAADKRQREYLAELCRRKLAEHEEAIRAIDADIDAIDESLFERGAAGEVPR